jgi:hypothetical protein
MKVGELVLPKTCHSYNGVRQCIYGTAAAYGPTDHPWIDMKTEELEKKPALVPLCPPQISHGPPWERTRVSAMRSHRLTICAVERNPWEGFGIRFKIWQWELSG